ncbi:MAG: hypothetical protein ACOCUH_01325 [Bacteriovoracia bacterium]
MSKYNTARIIRNLIYLFFVVAIVGYALYNSRIFIAGPQIEIFSPKSGETIEESPLVRIEGEARNISFIELNNRKINTNEENQFNEPVLLYPGYNVITILARDKFDRKVEKQIELVYKGENSEEIMDKNLDENGQIENEGVGEGEENNLENATTGPETSTSSPTTSLEEF